MDFNQLQTASNQWNSIINYEQVGKSYASFHLLSGVNLDIPLVSSKLNVIEKTIIFTNDKITTRRKRYLRSDLTSEGQCSRLKRKWRKPIKKVNTLKQKLQLFYNIKLSNATRRRYILIFMCFVSQRAR